MKKIFILFILLMMFTIVSAKEGEVTEPKYLECQDFQDILDDFDESFADIDIIGLHTENQKKAIYDFVDETLKKCKKHIDKRVSVDDTEHEFFNSEKEQINNLFSKLKIINLKYLEDLEKTTKWKMSTFTQYLDYLTTKGQNYYAANELEKFNKIQAEIKGLYALMANNFDDLDKEFFSSFKFFEEIDDPIYESGKRFEYKKYSNVKEYKENQLSDLKTKGSFEHYIDSMYEKSPSVRLKYNVAYYQFGSLAAEGKSNEEMTALALFSDNSVESYKYDIIKFVDPVTIGIIGTVIVSGIAWYIYYKMPADKLKARAALAKVELSLAENLISNLKSAVGEDNWPKVEAIWKKADGFDPNLPGIVNQRPNVEIYYNDACDIDKIYSEAFVTNEKGKFVYVPGNICEKWSEYLVGNFNLSLDELEQYSVSYRLLTIHNNFGKYQNPDVLNIPYEQIKAYLKSQALLLVEGGVNIGAENASYFLINYTGVSLGSR